MFGLFGLFDLTTFYFTPKLCIAQSSQQSAIVVCVCVREENEKKNAAENYIKVQVSEILIKDFLRHVCCKKSNMTLIFKNNSVT